MQHFVKRGILVCGVGEGDVIKEKTVLLFGYYKSSDPQCCAVWGLPCYSLYSLVPQLAL